VYNKDVKQEILEVFTDTCHTPEVGLCNLSFRTLLIANYTNEYLVNFYPNLAQFYGITFTRG